MILPIINRNKNKVNQSLIAQIHRMINMNKGKFDFIHQRVKNPKMQSFNSSRHTIFLESLISNISGRTPLLA
jgi:hypothetical protein